MLDRDVGAVTDRWNGPRWRWWTLAAGVLLIPATSLVAAILALASGDRALPILLLLLVLEILIASIVGSGVLDSVTSRMNRGGLARDATEFVDRAQTEPERAALEQENREIRDRRTIRAGILVLPLIAVFVVLMTQL